MKCSQSPFYLTSKIRNSEDISNKSCKLIFNSSVTLQVCYASKSEDANQRTTSLEVFFKNLDALYRFIRPYALIGTAMVPGLLMTIYEIAINQLYDVKIDKVNKPNLPLTSGDLSMRTGITIASSSLLMSLAMGITLQSPPFLFALIIWFLLGSAYSVDLPFLRWKGNPFLTTLYMVLERGLLLQFAYFIHIQKFVLGRPIAITRTLMFGVTIKCCFCVVISLLKDIPNEDGDREFGIQTLSIILGKESVLWLCVYVLFIAYGAAVIVGLTSSPYLLSKFVTIISHSMLAALLLHQARTVDLSSKESTLSFYVFIWKLHYAEYLLIPFVRL